MNLSLMWLEFQPGDAGLFLGLGVYFIIKERATVRHVKKKKEDVEEIEARFSDELIEPIQFIFVNGSTFGEMGRSDVEEWAEVAANKWDVDADQLVREVERVKADIEIRVRTGEFPPRADDEG